MSTQFPGVNRSLYTNYRSPGYDAPPRVATKLVAHSHAEVLSKPFKSHHPLLMITRRVCLCARYVCISLPLPLSLQEMKSVPGMCLACVHLLTDIACAAPSALSDYKPIAQFLVGHLDALVGAAPAPAPAGEKEKTGAASPGVDDEAM